MKKVIISLLLVIMCIVLVYSDEGGKKIAYEIKEGETAKYDGVLVPAEHYEKMMVAYLTQRKNVSLEERFEYQIDQYEKLLTLKQEEINLLTTKYNLEKQYRLELESQVFKSQLQIRALTVSTSIGFSISLAELLGIGVYAILYGTTFSR